MFVQLAALSLLLSLLCGFTTSYAVLARAEFLIVTIAHAVLAGLAALYYVASMLHVEVTDVHAWIAALVVALAVCASMIRIREHAERELISAVVFAITLSIAALFMALLPGHLIAKMWSFLTGSILLISPEDVLIVFLATLIACTLYTLFYRDFVLIAYDLEYALSTSIHARALNYLLSMLIALTTLVCVYTVGVFVTYAILMIPGTLMARARLRVSHMIILSVIVILVSLLCSVSLALLLNLPPSGLCGVIACLVSLLCYLVKFLYGRKATPS